MAGHVMANWVEDDGGASIAEVFHGRKGNEQAPRRVAIVAT